MRSRRLRARSPRPSRRPRLRRTASFPLLPNRNGLVVDPGEQPPRRREIDWIAIVPIALEEHVRGSGRSGEEAGLVGRARVGTAWQRARAVRGQRRNCAAPARAYARKVESFVRSANVSRASTMPACPMPTP